MRLLGILLVICGVALLLVGGVTLFVPQDVIDMGPMTLTIHENLAIPLPPVIGLACLAIGVLLMASAPVPVAPPPPPGPLPPPGPPMY
jgi:hypothetical protein